MSSTNRIRLSDQVLLKHIAGCFFFTFDPGVELRSMFEMLRIRFVTHIRVLLPIAAAKAP